MSYFLHEDDYIFDLFTAPDEMDAALRLVEVRMRATLFQQVYWMLNLGSRTDASHKVWLPAAGLQMWCVNDNYRSSSARILLNQLQKFVFSYKHVNLLNNIRICIVPIEYRNVSV